MNDKCLCGKEREIERKRENVSENTVDVSVIISLLERAGKV